MSDASFIERGIGLILQPLRAGEEKALIHDDTIVDAPATLRVTSSAFLHGGVMPVRYTQLGENIAPPLDWSVPPEGVQELVIVVEDADIPLLSPAAHALLFGLPPQLQALEEGWSHAGGRYGENTFGESSYTGPRPIAGHGVHRYVFQVFALREPSGLDAGASRADVAKALAGKVAAHGFMIGTFERD